MRQEPHPKSSRSVVSIAILALLVTASTLSAHIVPPERLHEATESYRRLAFVLGLNPVDWELVGQDLERIAKYDPKPQPLIAALGELGADLASVDLDAAERRSTARRLFELATTSVARSVDARLTASRSALADHRAAAKQLYEARQLWAAFEPTVKATDPKSFLALGECWLALSSSLGSPGVLGRGAIAADVATFEREAIEVQAFLAANYGRDFSASKPGRLAPIPYSSPSVDLGAPLPAQLPPGSNINKQLPRPRQVLNIGSRGVDEGETNLIALGDMAFDSPFIFGEPARSLGLSCNTCHNKSITNPGLFVPGLSARPGGLDVSNAFFAPHANNGVFDHLDTPDLRGIRFTAPYGRNGRFGSLREFTRNVIVNEFNGAEPSPLLLDGVIAYMLEFDFLPNPDLGPDGTLLPATSESARRGEEIFHREFEGMGARSCASCHIPSDHFVDRKRHDIGSVAGAEPHSRDGALDTPTLLSAKSTPPYFHDGSLPTLRAVNEWFNESFALGLDATELADLTEYVETVASGTDAFEDTLYTLEAELEEFSFFLSTYEFLKTRQATTEIDQTLATIALEIQAHKWDVQDPSQMPVLDRLIDLAVAARSALAEGDVTAADRYIDTYRTLYLNNAEVLK